MAAVALTHGLNANLLRRWVIDAERTGVASTVEPEPHGPAPARSPTFIPLALPAAPSDADIRIELQRGGTTVKVVWPAAAARECAAWLAEWLR